MNFVALTSHFTYVVRWPGVIEPGRVSDEIICHNNLMATCAEILGAKLPDDAGVDSFSILPVLRGDETKEPTHPFVSHHSISGRFAIRKGDWKFIACKGSGGWTKGHDGKPSQLYNMAEFPDARLLLLSIFETEESVHRATRAGALGCVSKAAEIDEMIVGIRAVARGEAYFSEGLAEKLAARLAREDLSPREIEVLSHLAAGLSNKEISAALQISGSTLKHHLQKIFVKLGAKDRTQAVTIAVQRGIVRLVDPGNP